MLLTLPYQSIDTSKFTIRPFVLDKKGRNVSHMTYQEGSSEIHDLAILLPPLPLIKYDATANRLQLDTSKERHFGSKWSTIQTKIIDTLYMNSNSIFSRNYTLEEIQMMIHSLFQNHCLTVYVFPSTIVHSENGTTCPITEVAAGTPIRCILRLHGLMMVEYRGISSVRIQHSLPFMSLAT